MQTSTVSKAQCTDCSIESISIFFNPSDSIKQLFGIVSRSQTTFFFYIRTFFPSKYKRKKVVWLREITFGRGCPVLYHSILLYFILSMAIVLQLTKCILLKFAPIMPAFCSLLLPSYFSKTIYMQQNRRIPMHNMRQVIHGRPST